MNLPPACHTIGSPLNNLGPDTQILSQHICPGYAQPFLLSDPGPFLSFRPFHFPPVQPDQNETKQKPLRNRQAVEDEDGQGRLIHSIPHRSLFTSASAWCLPGCPLPVPSDPVPPYPSGVPGSVALHSERLRTLSHCGAFLVCPQDVKCRVQA